MLALGVATGVGQLVGLGPVDPAEVGEEQQPVVRRRGEEVVDHVVGPQRGPTHALAAATLRAVGVDPGALGVAAAGDGDDHVLLGDEVLHRHVAVEELDPGAAVVAVLVDQLGQLVGHDGPLPLGLGEDVLEVEDHRLELVVLVDDLLALEGGQATQLHLEDRAGLDLVDLEQLDQPVAGRLDGLRPADQGDDLVERVERLEQTTQDVDLVLGLAQAELGPPLDDLDLVLDPVPDERVDRQRARHPVDQGEHVGAEVVLQLGVLVEVVEHHLGHRVALEHDDEALAGAARRLVADVGDAVEAALLGELGDLLRERVGVDLVGQLGDHEALPALDLLDLDDRAHDDRPAAGAVGVLDALATQDQRPGREVGTGDASQHRVERLVARRLRVGEHPLGGVGHLAQVVRRDVGRHADRDTGASR